MNPSPIPSGAAFHEDLAANWSAGYRGGGFRKRLDCFRPILARTVEPGSRWLDLGCGSGVLTAEMIGLGARVTAVDGSPAMLDNARAALAGAGEAEWMQADAQSVPLEDASFDGVLCSSVVEYVERPEAVLAEAARLLRPGGRLVLSVPPKLSAVRMAQKTARALSGLAGRAMFPYLSVSRFEISPGRIGPWMDEAGFRLEQVTKFDPKLPRAALSVLRPSLLLIEARKKEDR